MLAVDREAVAHDVDIGEPAVEPERSLHGVVAEQIGQIVSPDDVVDRDNVQPALGGDAIDQAADAPEAVDPDSKGHGGRR